LLCLLLGRTYPLGLLSLPTPSLSCPSTNSYVKYNINLCYYEYAVMSREMAAHPRFMPQLAHKGRFPYQSSAPPMARADGSAGHEVKKKLQRVCLFRRVLCESNIPHFSALASAGCPNTPDGRALSSTEMGTTRERGLGSSHAQTPRPRPGGPPAGDRGSVSHQKNPDSPGFSGRPIVRRC